MLFRSKAICPLPTLTFTSPSSVEQALQFRHRFGRHDDVGFVAAREFELDIDHRQAASIGRDQREFVFLEAEEDAVEHVARLVGRDRVGSFAQAVAQILLPNRDNFRVLKFRQRRKFLLRQAEDLEKALAAADGGGVFPIDIELDFARRQFANDVEEPPRRQRGRAFFFHLRFETPAHTDVEIGRGEANLVAVRLQQNVGKNRQRRARADDVLNLLQTFEKLFFGDAKFHDRDRRVKM